MIPDRVFIPYHTQAHIDAFWTEFKQLKQSDFVLSSDYASNGAIAIAEKIITDRHNDIYIYQRNIAERGLENCV